VGGHQEELRLVASCVVGNDASNPSLVHFGELSLHVLHYYGLNDLLPLFLLSAIN
jgi:hypothetical protein